MNIMAVKTADTIAAVDRIKKLTSKKFNSGVSFETPKEFVEKRNYMQCDEFINDSHNKRMFSVIDEIMKCRDGIAKDIENINLVIRDKLAQAINGYARMKDDLDKDYALNFNSADETLQTPNQIQYRLLKNVLLKCLAQKAI